METTVTTSVGSRYDLSTMEDGTDKKILSMVCEKNTISQIGTTREAKVIASEIFTECAHIVGGKQGTDAEWRQTQAIIFDALQECYGGLTYEEIRQAFHMVIGTELNAYLPKDASGEPKKECVGRMKPAYFCRVLDAYKKRRSDAQNKYYEQQAERERERERMAPQSAEADEIGRKKVREVYERWKASGHVVQFIGAEDVQVYGWLTRHGLIRDSDPTPTDQKKAYETFMARAKDSGRSLYEVKAVERLGIKAPNIQAAARLYMIHRRLEEAFYVFDKKGW